MRLLQNKFPTRPLIQRLLARRIGGKPSTRMDMPRVTLRAEGTSLETLALQTMALRSFGNTAPR
ncbi:hypothetical protein [Phaeobacter gallaeciensis]|uniref:Uncharacterized protein n=1 Tax=Phaeobacter gallaeciensis TaxID=60890 RepID=A0AAC9Z905_9RHOB|nr:hypothetical protein [Phaeobacter gallaeciensis]AHD09490.1 hypothetical protein Gal_01734 [Phaeobacter gallaeciensis DSM 26640]ATE92753.1 hypothetical protein PhaeoP11_01725 [Phaeobacter gallaeciensis]ATE97425.1 hypothetical protein PhaeoP73_02121 [Phaeobacter gallaeciensis]ATF01418.1 hypothetical protein PhaeoP75_01775 [Phaeobacter gallaeciensis]ATF05798.1 hypothetical protein PhaeoP63_01723 [Phaeobacter gallaeciensis]